MNVTLADFCPINPWIPRNNDLIDYFTGRAYSLEPKVLVGFKCFLLTIGTIPVHLLAATKADIAGLGRILSFYHLNTRPPMDFWTRFKVAIGLIDPPLSRWNWMVRQNTKELGRILLSPITIVGLELSAMYGVVSPWNGRKLYASFERLQYGDYVLAPCFQPDPVGHLFNITIHGAQF